MNMIKTASNGWSKMKNLLMAKGMDQSRKIEGLCIEGKAMKEYLTQKWQKFVPQRLKLLCTTQHGATLVEILGYAAVVIILLIVLVGVLKPKIQPYLDGWFNKLDLS